MKTVEFVQKGKAKFNATKAQYNYLKSLGAEICVFENRFLNYFSKKQASEAIDLLKAGHKVVFK
ncbi:MAG TPA: hypothetical protein GX692_07545 [Acholeplasmataceae bacterium]|nr:hypothetical protein [Acholeplasmataceae bacterium]